jgi:hypothetical protein
MPAPTDLNALVDRIIAETPVFDVHTHLYPASMGPLSLWGIDELMSYHYLIAEVMRVSPITYEQFWKLSKPEQADHIWKHLFVENAPVSEACRGVLTVIKRLGLDANTTSLKPLREAFASRTTAQQIDHIIKLSNCRGLTMTNDVFDDVEYGIWQKNPERDPRFKAVLRIDPLLLGWPKVGEKLRGWGYKASDDLGGDSMKEVRRFLTDWIGRMDAQYVACSLPPSFRYPDDSPTTRVIREAILPVTREKNLPFAMMIGVKKLVNPQLRLAGDSVAKSDINSLERILAENPHNKFLCTMLARENQHELAVAARKFRNLLVFGCWWFLNNPVIIEEMTRMRMELLGPSVVPQHSDCRVLEQLLYKWDHSRAIIGKVVKDKINDTLAAGYNVSEQQIRKLIHGYFGGVYEDFQKATISA